MCSYFQTFGYVLDLSFITTLTILYEITFKIFMFEFSYLHDFVWIWLAKQIIHFILIHSDEKLLQSQMYKFRPDGDILYPSYATSCNNTAKIQTDNDIQMICNEFQILPAEKIIERHFVHGNNSSMRLKRLLAVQFHISKFEYFHLS